MVQSLLGILSLSLCLSSTLSVYLKINKLKKKIVNPKSEGYILSPECGKYRRNVV